MRRSVPVVFLSGVLMMITPASVYAAATAKPSPQSSSAAKPEKQILTQAQKAAIATAKLAFYAAKTEAQNGLDRALADAKAVRDQAILAAGTDKNAVASAKQTYKDSYRMILNAYKMDIRNVKAILLSATTAAYALRT